MVKQTISRKELLSSMELLQTQLDNIKSLLNATTVSKKQDVSVKKPSVKKAVSKAVKPAVKATPKTASPSPKAPKSWHKFSLDNLPKSYTFLKVSFKEGSKAQYGRFLHTSLTKEKNIFIDVLDNKNTTIRIPFENIKQVYEYR